MAWSDEKKAQAITMYQESEPTPQNSIEIVNEIAEELGESANGVRMILQKANVYINKAPTTKAASTSGSTGATRVSKEASHARLVEAITQAGQNPDSDIISKLTGKAALHFAELFENLK